MPPIRTLSVAKPIKTERTHEENQERAYIAASRRSDRSLEARIESARRASDIHKKRTGRALRVTEQDVINEEMYEEEDDDLPAQYQRLSAHLQSNSLLFNRKLHDYITTQTAVRSSFMQQQLMQQYPHAQYFPQQSVQFSQGVNPFMGHQMGPPQTFSQPTQAYPPQAYQQQSPNNYRQTPYQVPQRPQPHQRSASIATPQHYPGFNVATSAPTGQPGTPRGDEHRRMSLPPHIDTGFAQAPSHTPTTPQIKQQPESPSLSSPYAPSPKGQVSNSSSPHSAHETPKTISESTTPLAFSSLPVEQQVINMNPISLSLPPESQQFVGNALDPSDPNTAILMAGSDNIPQPWRPTYRYNPNISPKSSRPWNAQSVPADATFSSKPSINDGMASVPTPADAMPTMSTRQASPELFNSASFDVNASVDFYGGEYTHEDFDESAFLNFAD